MNIPIFRLNYEEEFIEEYLQGAKDILTEGFIGEFGKHVKMFEESFAELIDTKYCAAVANGTSALEVALKTIDVRGKKVIMPSNTFFATSIAVTNADAEIVLVDIEEENFSICPEDLKRKMTEDVGAVIIVHIGGIISKHYKEIQSICKENNVALIEDAAHAHSSNIDGNYAGSIGDMGCFSFFPTKVMTTGEGGMVSTNNEEYHKRIRSIKNFGRHLDDAGLCVTPQGQHSTISNFTGLLGHLETKRAKDRVALRREYVELYDTLLKGTGYEVVKQERGNCAYYKCIVKIPCEREWLRQYCKERNITLTGEVYKKPVHQQPLYQDREYNLPVTDKVCASHICPPLYPELTVEEIVYICDVLKQAEVDYGKE